MGPISGTAMFIIIWWTVLFAVLPIGVRPNPDGDPEAGGWRGVPEQPRLLRKVVLTTLIAAVIWGGAYALVASDWMSFRSGPWALPSK